VPRRARRRRLSAAGEPPPPLDPALASAATLRLPLPTPVRISYGLMAATFVLAGVLHLGALLLAALFSYLILQKLRPLRRPWLAVLVFLALVVALAGALGAFAAQAVVTLPQVADKSIPSIIDWAESHGIALPFTDWHSLKVVAMESARGRLSTLGRVATGATREVILLLIGMGIAVALYLRPGLDLDRHRHPLHNNLYSLTCDALTTRWSLFYRCFDRMMGAQLLISLINTTLTAVFVIAVGLPYTLVIIGVAFLCGLLPVVGNLLSNTVIVAIAFTVSPRTALMALAFLVFIHKLEYFVNGKIVGDRIRNPLWLTLLGLILGETLMGIPGMILAPALLAHLKAEGALIEVPATEASAAAAARAREAG